MKSTSGAHIFEVGGRVVKIGTGDVGRRAKAQAIYCRRFDPVAVPRVDLVLPRGCVMEKLTPYTTPERYVADVTHLLTSYFWTKCTSDNPDWLVHFDYITHRTSQCAPEFLGSVLDVWKRFTLEDECLWTCMTHGDPTYDNMMMRDRKPVLIDPLPPYIGGEMPQLASVDVGKVLQSIIGYEHIKYDRIVFPQHDVHALIGQLFNTLELTEVEQRASYWFLISHIVRLMPYQPTHKQPACKAMLDTAIRLARAAA